ncbi:hypothetical protein LMH73_002475 [Vibrio splendidus]|nr:hypothetical protein [Vibrio splendidus]MCC4880448.1 hypothetical protein [Vibrio splendidus]
MLGHKTIDNIKAISSGKPSLFVEKTEHFISVSTYIDNPNSSDKYDVIAHLCAIRMPNTIENRPVYKVTGTSGAYPGFGSLVYQSLLIELSRENEKPLFISDRESVTGFANGIYDKMIASDEYRTHKIPVDNDNYSIALEEDIMYDRIEESGLDADEIMDSDDFNDSVYLALVSSGDIQHLPLNLAYEWVGNDISNKYHNLLLNNNNQRNLSDKDVGFILNTGGNLGDYVTDNYNELIELRDGGFAHLNSNYKAEAIFSM